jgi:hypothetical protein
MSWLVERNDPFAARPVTLAPISDEQQTDRNLEPPFVRIRDGNESFVYADSEARDDRTSQNDYILGGGDRQFYARKLQRIALEGFQVALSTPNINARNNTLVFHSAVSDTDYGVTIPEGYYSNVASAAAALETALNLAEIPSGLHFTITVDPLNPFKLNINAAGGAFHFEPSSPMITHGRYLFNLPSETVDTTSKTAGAAFLMYSRYFDIVSNAFTEHTKNPNTSNTRAPNALVKRVFLDGAGGIGGVPISGISSTISEAGAVSTNYDRTRALEVLDIRILDEFKEPFYMPSLSSGTPGNSGFTFVIKTEL